MKKFYCYLFCAIMIGMCSCTNGSVSNSEGGIQIDPELKELGELNTLVLQYDDVSDKVGDYLVVKSHNKWGVINLKGDTIIGFDYDEIRDYPDGYWSICKRRSVKGNDFNVGLAKIDGTILFPPVDNGYKCGPIAKGLYFVKKSNGYVFFNDKGEEVSLVDEESGIEIPYPKEVYEFGEKSFLALLANTRWYRIPVKEDETICEVEDTEGYVDVKTCGDLCYVKNDEGKWGAIDVDGNLVIPYIYSNADKRGDGVNCVFVQNEDGKWGFIKGKEMIGSYDNFLFSNKNFAFVKDGEYKVVLDANGKEIFRAEDLSEYSKFDEYDGCFRGLRHIYDSNGKTIVTVDDSLRINTYLNGYVGVSDMEQRNWAILDKDGKVVVPFDDVYYQKGKESIEIVKSVMDNGRLNILSTNLFNTKSGKYIEVPFTIDSFVEDYYLASIEGRRIFIDENGKTGFLDFDEVLNNMKENRKRNEANAQNGLEESIKEQLMKIINEENEREVISSPDKIDELTKEDGKYWALFYDYGEYFTTKYAIRDIIVDKDGIVKDFKIKSLVKTPTDKVKHVEGGINALDQLEYYNQKLREGNRYNPYK